MGRVHSLCFDLYASVWLSPASPWSLTARLIVMMTEKLEPESLNDSPRFYLDGDIYPFAWNQTKNTDPLETSGLPSLDYALHLFHIVRFHLGQAYRFFDDEADFVSRTRDFYKKPSDEKTADPGFWFVQFLMILALGNAFISRPRHQKDPPGSKYFTRAMAAMPSYTSTGQDSLVAIEALALVGLYLYSIDHREAAHVHVSFLPTRFSSCSFGRDRLAMPFELHSWRACIHSSPKKLSGPQQ